MSDDGNKETDLKVTDRRTTSGNKDPEPEKKEERTSDSGKAPEDTGAGAGSIPKVDFSTFVFSLFSSALIQLGDMADPVTGEKPAERNLDAVSQTIDLLDLLKEKTEGNLTEDETQLINESTAQLKFKYIDAVKEKG